MQRLIPYSQNLRQSRRRGTAPLEFVMALPLFVVLFLALFLVCAAMLHRMAAIEQTRMATWSDLPSTQPSQQMTLLRPTLDGKKENMTTIPFKTQGMLSVRADAMASTMTIAGTWDHETVPFQDRVPAYAGHREPAQQIGNNWNPVSGISSMLRTTSAQMRHLQAQVAPW